MIRQAAERDAAGVLAIYEPIVRDTPISFEMEPPTEEKMAARIARSHEWLVIERDRYIIGYAYAPLSWARCLQVVRRDIHLPRAGRARFGSRAQAPFGITRQTVAARLRQCLCRDSPS